MCLYIHLATYTRHGNVDKIIIKVRKFHFTELNQPFQRFLPAKFLIFIYNEMENNLKYILFHEDNC